MPAPTTNNAAEVNFDGLVGPTHNYAGLSPGNLASIGHGGQVANPKQAALEGLRKMRHLAKLGVPQAVLPPQERPDVATLKRLGFVGDDRRVIEKAAKQAAHLLVRCSSASCMWTANAATVAPSDDTLDGRVHIVPANLTSLFHRSIESRSTTRILSRIFADEGAFVVHDALPALPGFGDEGAANHTRLSSSLGSAHLFAWGQDPEGRTAKPLKHPARQSLGASQAVARLQQLRSAQVVFWQQHPSGIDHGAFHTDVLAVGNEDFFMLHELAFVEHQRLVELLGQHIGPSFRYVLARDAELPVADAIASYPFNSQVVTLPGGEMCIIAPLESEETTSTRRFLERVVSEDNAVARVEYLDVRQSMANGGGPACLRLRVVLTEEERGRLGARVLLDDALASALERWIETHYRDRLAPADLSDPELLFECRHALDELTGILRLGSVYEFQR